MPNGPPAFDCRGAVAASGQLLVWLLASQMRRTSAIQPGHMTGPKIFGGNSSPLSKLMDSSRSAEIAPFGHQLRSMSRAEGERLAECYSCVSTLPNRWSLSLAPSKEAPSERQEHVIARKQTGQVWRTEKMCRPRYI